MEAQANTSKFTTVSVDAMTREHINSEAARLGLNQREMLKRMIETYDFAQKHEDNADHRVSEDDVQELFKIVLQRDDRLVSFIRQQETDLLNPILQAVQSTDMRLKVLIEVLKEID